jgi:RimJ/RimL family protein N-acetyltransferase
MDLKLKTKRLLLRPLELDDLELCVSLFADPDVMAYVREPQTRQQVEDKMPLICGRAGGIGVWCVCDIATGEKMGTAVLLPMPIEEDELDWTLMKGPDVPAGEIEVGYILKQSAWGRGIATEACRRLLKFGFEVLALDEIVAVTDPDNAASQRVLQKCGLAMNGTRRAYKHDGLPDYRISRADWLKR